VKTHHSTNCARLVIGTVLAVSLVSFAAGCSTKEAWREPGPRATFETFLMSVFRGEDEAAFAAIAPEDRDVLTAALDEMDDLPEEARPQPHEMWVITAVDNPYDVKRVEVREELTAEPKKGARVTLDISYQDGRTGTATMVWGGERWFVDLPLDDAKPATDEG
jgi:hypothetical protein